MFSGIFDWIDDKIGIDISMSNITAMLTDETTWGSFGENLRANIKVDWSSVLKSLAEKFKAKQISNIKSPISFKMPSLTNPFSSLTLPELPDLPEIKIPEAITTISLLGGKEFGEYNLNTNFKKFRQDRTYPDYGNYGGVRDKTTSPRGLVNPGAEEITDGAAVASSLTKQANPDLTRPGAGPYSRLVSAVDDVNKHYSPQGNETNFMVGSMDSVHSQTVGKGNSAESKKGDFMTLWPITTGDDIATAMGDKKTEFEVGKHGMPFYFKDLRSNEFILFRGYLDGINETVSPSWAPENYVGRSEPVYIYERAERSISFGLKLYAQTEDELSILYKKKNKLTSLCYPEYKKDELIGNDFSRMKPPLTKFRMGDLYGKGNHELTGFIESLTYTVDDVSPWEIKQGKQVPKLMSISITYKVIHLQPPSSDTTFYGLGA